MEIIREIPQGARTGNIGDVMFCEHCAFSNFAESGIAGQCLANPPQVVLVPQQQRDISTGQMVFVPAVQSCFPPVERRSHCFTFEPRVAFIGESLDR